MIAASNSWLSIYDNLSSLPTWLGDTFCTISTGGGLACRELYTDDEEALFDVKRPQILNSIVELTSRPDMLDRAILFTLPRIKDGDRKTEEEIESELERIRPGVLGAILDAISHGLGAFSSVEIKDKPRLADFAVWAEACGGALGWKEGAFLAAFKENQKESKKTLIENDMFATALYNFVIGGEDGAVFEDSISLLLTALEGRSGINATNRPDGWPKTARWARGKINRIAPALRALGIDVTFTRDEKIRKVKLEKLPESKQSNFSVMGEEDENQQQDQQYENNADNSHDANDDNTFLASCEKQQQANAQNVHDARRGKNPNFNLDREEMEIKKEKGDREEKDRKSSVIASLASSEPEAYRKNHDANMTLKNPSVIHDTVEPPILPYSVDATDGEEIDAILDIADIRDALESQGKRITFGNVEAYLEAKNGGYVEPREVKKILNAFAYVGYITTKDGAMVAGCP